MGKKKGGAKNKLARMSEEERARYLQHRADLEEEARRRKQHLIALYMKNKLKREEAFSRLNLAKINLEWRSILRQIKCSELKNEIMAVEKLFNDTLNQKDRILRRLLGDLDEAEELYSNLQQTHIEVMEKVFYIQSQRMEFFKKNYTTQKNTILKYYKEDSEENKKRRSKSQIELECVYFALEDNGEKRVKALEEGHLNRMDELRSIMAFKLEQITESREKEIEKIWNKYLEIINGYVQYTEEFYAEYLELRERDEINTVRICRYCNEVDKLTEEMSELKIQHDNSKEAADFQIEYLEKYRNTVNDKFLEMKNSLEMTIRFDHEQFRTMVVSGHGAIKALEKVCKKSESLLQLSAICRKYETEKEKIIIFEKPQSVTNEENKQYEPHSKDLSSATFKNWMSLELFWVRVNKVRLDVACLKEEKNSLEKENAILKSKLKEYLTNLSINAGSNGNVNERINQRPSSIRIQKAMHIHLDLNKRSATAGPPSTKSILKRRKPKIRPYTCVEANLSNAVRSAKMVEGKSNTVKIVRIVNW